MMGVLEKINWKHFFSSWFFIAKDIGKTRLLFWDRFTSSKYWDRLLARFSLKVYTPIHNVSRVAYCIYAERKVIWVNLEKRKY